ncbi:MAG: OmpH family outer membrane protein [Myxococcales bacterium]|nr:OmpH family outer membrane protein [Myxococcales bacterium]MCH7867556.1 OmpH family outer membrane protein [Myxococcales bacterium]
MRDLTSRKLTVVVTAVLLLGWGLGASTQTTKIGIVDLDQAVSSTTEGKAARDELERKKREAEQSLQPLIERYQTMAKDFDAKQFVLSDDARFQKQLDLQELRQEIEHKQQQLQGKLEVARERLVGPLRTKLVGIVETMGREDGFSFIMMRNTPGLVYTREALDITDQVIEKFNEQG